MKNKRLSKNILLGFILVLLLILFILISLQGHSNLKILSKNHIASSLDFTDQRMKNLVLEINNFPTSAGGEILFLSELSHIGDVANLVKNEFSESSIKKSEEDFLLFVKENSAYYQLRYIDENGMEIVKAVFDGEEHKIIPESELQNKSYTYYFAETMKLKKGEIFVSKLDLNVENGAVENRGSKENPIYIPVLRYASPIFDKNENRKGIVVSNVYADYFLEDIRRAQREGEEVFLINNEGYYLAHPDKSKEFSFIFEDRDYNFYRDYPEINKEQIDFNKKKRVETEELIFTFEYIYPTATSFEVYEGSEKVFGKNSEDRYYWILISVSDKETINNSLKKMKKDYFYSLFFYGVIILFIFILVLFGFRNREKRK